MDRSWLAKLRDLMTELEKLRRRKTYAHGQVGHNEGGRLGRGGLTPPGVDPLAVDPKHPLNPY